MMHVLRKRGALIIAIVLVMALLAACGSSGGNSAASSGNASNSGSSSSSSSNSGSSGSNSGSNSNASNSGSNSSASNNSSSSNSGSSGSSSAQAGATLNVAVAAPYSGNESFIGPWFETGTKTAVDQINKAGGILGHKLNVVTADTAGDPVDAVPAVKQLVGTKHPVMMIGPSSLAIMSVIKILNNDHMVTVALGGTTQLDKMQYKYIFRTNPSDSQMGVAMAYYGIQKGYKHPALVFGSNSSAQTLVGPIKSNLESHGAKPVIDETITPDQSSYRSEITKIIAAKPDAIFMQVDPQTASTFFSEWKQLGGKDIPVIGSDVVGSSDFIKAIGKDEAHKVIVSVHPSTSGGSAWNEYVKFYNALYNKKPMTASQNAYDGVNIAALAMVAANSTDPTKYVGYMTKVSNPPGKKVYDFKSGLAALKAGQQINYEGAGGPNDFNKYHNVFGAFEADTFDASGNSQAAMNIAPGALKTFTSSK